MRPSKKVASGSQHAGYAAPLPWLRLWTDFVHDPKVQMLSETMQRRYIMLLCYTALRLVPAEDDAAVAYALRLSTKEMQRTKNVLARAKLIGKDWKPLAWERRQYASDHSGAERQRRYRDKYRDSNVTVTAASRHGDDLEGEVEDRKNQNQKREDEDVEGERDSSQQRGASQPGQSDNDQKSALREMVKDTIRQKSPSRSRKNGNFEQINSAVQRLITERVCSGDDYGDIARCAGITEAQARESVRQLKDRGCIP